MVEVDHHPLIARFTFLRELLQVVLEGLVSDEIREAPVGGRVQSLNQDAFDVARPAFVEPEVGRVGLSV